MMASEVRVWMTRSLKMWLSVLENCSKICDIVIALHPEMSGFL